MELNFAHQVVRESFNTPVTHMSLVFAANLHPARVLVQDRREETPMVVTNDEPTAGSAKLLVSVCTKHVLNISTGAPTDGNVPAPWYLYFARDTAVQV